MLEVRKFWLCSKNLCCLLSCFSLLFFFSFGTQSREGKKTTWMILKNYRLLLQIHKFSGSTPAEFAYTVERLESQFGGLNRGTNIY